MRCASSLAAPGAGVVDRGVEGGSFGGGRSAAARALLGQARKFPCSPRVARTTQGGALCCRRGHALYGRWRARRGVLVGRPPGQPRDGCRQQRGVGRGYRRPARPRSHPGSVVVPDGVRWRWRANSGRGSRPWLRRASWLARLDADVVDRGVKDGGLDGRDCGCAGARFVGPGAKLPALPMRVRNRPGPLCAVGAGMLGAVGGVSSEACSLGEHLGGLASDVGRVPVQQRVRRCRERCGLGRHGWPRSICRDR